jgi:hypothetical protein
MTEKLKFFANAPLTLTLCELSSNHKAGRHKGVPYSKIDVVVGAILVVARSRNFLVNV